MKETVTNQDGRSMIEMLGVLAIVGTLSMGGIAGFSTAMTRYKTIREMEKYNLFLQGIMEHKSLILKSGNQYNTQFYFFSEDVEKLKILPSGWYRKGSQLYDTIGNRLMVYSGSSKTGIVWGVYQNLKKEEKVNKEFCTILWRDFILPNQEWIGNTWINGSGGKSGTYYGTHTCSKNKQCLSNITITDIQKFCASCAEETVCNIIVTFN